MKEFEDILQETKFYQYKATVKIKYNNDEGRNLGAEKLAEMIRALPGATRVSTAYLDKDNEICILDVRLISQKGPREAFISLKRNALSKFSGDILSFEVGTGTIETQNFISEGKLLTEVSIEDVKKQFVDTNKISQKDFETACKISNNKSNWVTWFAKRISTGLVDISTEESEEDWGKVVAMFSRFPHKFEIKDINQYKSAEQIENLFRTGIEIIDSNDRSDPESCRVGEVKSLDRKVTYTIYRLPHGKTDEDTYKISQKLGKTSKGGWCTASGRTKQYFNYHLSTLSTYGDIFIVVNRKNRALDKFQIQPGYHEGLPFDVNDVCVKNTSVLRDLSPVYEFLKEKYGISIPYKVQRAAETGLSAEEVEKFKKKCEVFPGIYFIPKNSQEYDLIEMLNYFIGGNTGIPGSRGIGPNCIGILVFTSYPYVPIIYSRTEGRVFLSTLQPYTNKKTLQDKALVPNSEENKLLLKIFHKLQLPLPLMYKIFSMPESEFNSKYFRTVVGKDIELYVCLENEVEGVLSYILSQNGITEKKFDAHMFPEMHEKAALFVQNGKIDVLFREPAWNMHIRGGKEKYGNYNELNTCKLYGVLQEENIMNIPRRYVATDNIIHERNIPEHCIEEPVGVAEKLYRFTADSRALCPFTYRPPVGTVECYLGITPEYVFRIIPGIRLTVWGKWTVGNSPSFIQSVPGLGQTLGQIYNKYHIAPNSEYLDWKEKYGNGVQRGSRKKGISLHETN